MKRQKQTFPVERSFRRLERSQKGNASQSTSSVRVYKVEISCAGSNNPFSRQLLLGVFRGFLRELLDFQLGEKGLVPEHGVLENLIVRDELKICI